MKIKKRRHVWTPGGKDYAARCGRCGWEYVFVPKRGVRDYFIRDGLRFEGRGTPRCEEVPKS